MKKVITAAALFAASTALANAALVVSYESFTGTTQAGAEGNNTMKSSSGYEPSFADGVATFDGSGNGDVLFLDGTAIDALKIGGSYGFSVTMQISNLSYGNGNGTIFSFNQSGGKWGIDVKNDGSGTFIGHWGGSQNSTGYGDGLAIPTGTFIMTVVQSSTNTLLYLDGELAHTFAGLGASTATDVTQMNIGNSNAGGDGVNMALSQLYIHDTALSASEVAAFVSTIPEPSAFGLLAGAGALALVAARRRRSRAK